MIIENIAGIILIILLIGLLYIYKTRGFTKHGKFAKPSNTYFWFQVGLLVFLFLWQPWNE